MERPAHREVYFDQTERPRRAPRNEVAGPAMVSPDEFAPEDLARSAEKITAACMEVHRRLGAALDVVVYQRALALEMQTRGLVFAREERIPIAYRGRQIETRRVEFIVEGCLVELRSQPTFATEDVLRATNYLKASGYGCTVLVNFGSPKVEVRTLTNERSPEE
ncbi:MAG: GxxExxY protein [Chloroflexota bacterium]